MKDSEGVGGKVAKTLIKQSTFRPGRHGGKSMEYKFRKVLSLRSQREGTIQTRPRMSAVRVAADAEHEAVYAAPYAGLVAGSGPRCHCDI